MLRPQVFPRVFAGGDPDGQHARDENQVCRGNDEPEEVAQVSFSNDAGERDGEGNLGPGGREGGHGRRGVLENEEPALVVVGGIAGSDYTAQQGRGDEQDDLSEELETGRC